MGSHKRHRQEDSDDSSSSSSSRERRMRKKDKKEKKHKKDHKKREEDMLSKAKEFLQQRSQGQIAPSAKAPSCVPPQKRITINDYFIKSHEFIAWLSERKGILFSELGSNEARLLFEGGFVTEWNTGGLRPAYYGGLIQAPVKRTSHKWAFEGSLGGGLGSRQTGTGAFLEDNKQARIDSREQDRHSRRKDVRDQRDLLDEMLPKASGRDAMVEKKVARREEARARDASPDRAFLPGGGDAMGMGGEDSFAAAKAREARQNEWRQNKLIVKREELSAKLASVQAKEDEKMQMFRQMLQQGPITIAKRT